MSRQIDELTEEILRNYGNRKAEGRLDLVYDAGTKKFYAVPRNQEHSEFMPTLPGELNALIPVQLRTKRKNGKISVTHLLVGASSFEAKHKVRHPFRYLVDAYRESFRLLANPLLEIDPIRFEIIKKYSMH